LVEQGISQQGHSRVHMTTNSPQQVLFGSKEFTGEDFESQEDRAHPTRVISSSPFTPCAFVMEMPFDRLLARRDGLRGVRERNLNRENEGEDKQLEVATVFHFHSANVTSTVRPETASSSD
jgi:hypothetical protein